MEKKEELEQRLAAAEARRATADAARQGREAERELLNAVERAEREAREAEALVELEAEHGALNEQIRAVYLPGGMIVVKKAAGITMRKYLDAGKTTVQSYEQLFRPCVVYPQDKAELNRLLDEYGAGYSKCADAVCWLAGYGRKELEGKSEA